MEWWQFVVLPLVTAFAGFLPVIFYRQNISQRRMARFRRALDCAADFRRLARDAGIEDSDVKEEYEEVEERYQVLLREYEKMNGFPK